jgi:ribonuclease P/MRP protein subunit POP5
MVKAAAMRKRYILFELQGEPAEEETLKRALYAEALRFFGELGMSRAAFKLVEFDPKTKRGIIRCERSHLEEVLGFLALLGSLDGKPARVRSLKSSGTIAALKRS